MQYDQIRFLLNTVDEEKDAAIRVHNGENNPPLVYFGIQVCKSGIVQQCQGAAGSLVSRVNSESKLQCFQLNLKYTNIHTTLAT